MQLSQVVKEVIHQIWGEHQETMQQHRKREDELFWLERRLKKEKDIAEKRRIEKKIIEKTTELQETHVRRSGN